ncbi:porin [Pseudorhodoferax soli]|uniref:Putative porin n=1 Tax=Pseudorhodoferax soli TaxID=545864 RepID=A0A368XRP7_9BURK|nr:porin [Pseudorhodoferax soli]RCW70545.1 putative porin [Pseudorhodoferax soli]
MKTIRSTATFPCILAFGLGLATAAHAQGEPAGGVTIYGLMDACLTRSDRGADRATAINSGCLYGSRLGFRGTEDLGGGLRASFVLETGLTIDTGELAQGGRAFGRKALVSLAGRWGAIEMGRDYAPAFYVVQPIDPMALGIGTASSTLWTGAASTSAARNNNVVNLLSPTWNGLSLRLQATVGDERADGSRKARGLNVLYRSGKTLAGISHTRVDNADDLAHDAGTTVGVRHDFGAFTLAGIAQSGAWRGTRTTSAASATSIFSRSYRSYLVGGSVPVAATTKVNASWKRYDDRTAGNFDASQLSVNVVHTLSRRTDLYAGYSRLKNLRASSYSVSDASTAYTGVTPGASTSLLAAGIKHTF